MPDFPITIKPIDVRNLMAKYEEKNTRTVMDVNVREDEIIQVKNENFDQQKRHIKDKITQMDDTMELLKRKLSE